MAILVVYSRREYTTITNDGDIVTATVTMIARIEAMSDAAVRAALRGPRRRGTAAKRAEQAGLTARLLGDDVRSAVERELDR